MKIFSLYAMILLYAAAGVNHFLHPDTYIKIMPSWIPFHKEMVLLSGIFEILFAVLLIFPRTRLVGAWCIILLLIAVFPANIQMAFNADPGNSLQFYLSIVRLPVQILLIYWAYYFTKKRI